MVDDYERGFDGVAREFNRRLLTGISVLIVVLLALAAFSWGVRLQGTAALVFAGIVVTLLVAMYVALRREYCRGYDSFKRGAHFDQSWNRARLMGWCDAMMDHEDDLGFRR